MSTITRWATALAIVGGLAACDDTTEPTSLASADGSGVLLGGTRQEVRLAADPAGGLASGKAKFEQRSDRTRFSTEVEDVSQSGPLTVTINGNSVGMITIALGGGDLNLDSRDGDDVSNVAAGGFVEVFDGTTRILSGTLAAKP